MGFAAGDSTALSGSSFLSAKQGPLSGSGYLVLLVYGSAIFLLGQLAPWYLSKHEVFYSQTAREMLASGNWFVPTLTGRPSLQKPPLIYWSIGLAMALFHSRSEWVARFPSVVAALFAAMFVADMAARQLSVRIGSFAGLIQLSSLWTIVKARQAVPDMILVAAVAGAMWAFATANVGDSKPSLRNRSLARVFFLCQGAALLVKGPTGAALTLPPILLFVLIERERRAWRFLLDPLGISIFLAVGVAWPVAIYHHYPQLLEIWRLENLDRFTGPDGMALDRNSSFAYLADVLWCTAPWTPFLFAGALAVGRGEFTQRPIWRFLALWFLAGLLQLSFGASKRFQYAMPIFPPLSILAARGFAWSADQYPLRVGRGTTRALAVSLCVAGIVAVKAALKPEVATAASCLVLLAVVGLYLAHQMGQKSRPRMLASASFATVGLMAVLGQIFVMPAYDPNVGKVAFANLINQQVSGDQPLYAINPLGLHFPYFLEVEFYLDAPLTQLEKPADLRKAILSTASRTGYVLIDPYFANQLERLGRVDLIQEEADSSRQADPIEHLMLMKLTVPADSPG